MEIGKRIKEGREFKGLKSKDFASLLNIDGSQYSKIENGKLLPTLLQIIEISKHLDLSLDWLILGKKVEPVTIESSNRDIIELAKQNISLQQDIIKLKDQLHEMEISKIDLKHKSIPASPSNLYVAEPEYELKHKKDR